MCTRISLILLLCISASAIDKKELFADAAQLAASAGDAYMTQQGRQRANFQELNPIARPFMGSTSGLVVFFSGSAAIPIIMGHFLHRKGFYKAELLERSTAFAGNASAAIWDYKQLH